MFLIHLIMIAHLEVSVIKPGTCCTRCSVALPSFHYHFNCFSFLNCHLTILPHSINQFKGGCLHTNMQISDWIWNAWCTSEHVYPSIQFQLKTWHFWHSLYFMHQSQWTCFQHPCLSSGSRISPWNYPCVFLSRSLHWNLWTVRLLIFFPIELCPFIVSLWSRLSLSGCLGSHYRETPDTWGFLTHLPASVIRTFVVVVEKDSSE